MAHLYGAQKLVLKAIEDSPKDPAGFVTDAQVAEATSIDLQAVRDWFETLESEGYVEVARMKGGLSTSITASGRRALQQFQPFSMQTPNTVPRHETTRAEAISDETDVQPGGFTPEETERLRLEEESVECRTPNTGQEFHELLENLPEAVSDHRTKITNRQENESQQAEIYRQAERVIGRSPNFEFLDIWLQKQMDKLHYNDPEYDIKRRVLQTAIDVGADAFAGRYWRRASEVGTLIPFVTVYIKAIEKQRKIQARLRLLRKLKDYGQISFRVCMLMLLSTIFAFISIFYANWTWAMLTVNISALWFKNVSVHKFCIMATSGFFILSAVGTSRQLKREAHDGRVPGWQILFSIINVIISTIFGINLISNWGGIALNGLQIVLPSDLLTRISLGFCFVSGCALFIYIIFSTIEIVYMEFKAAAAE